MSAVERSRGRRPAEDGRVARALLRHADLDDTGRGGERGRARENANAIVSS